MRLVPLGRFWHIRGMRPQSVHQFSVLIAPEAGEAVAELLLTIFGETPSTYVDVIKQVAVVSVYLPQSRRPRTGEVKRVRAGLENIRACGLDIGAGEIHTRLVRKADWLESWKKHFIPLDIGGRLLIKPSWEQRKARKGQHEIILDPGISFGTGHHATTAFCLRQLVEQRRADSRQSFLDIGTGSGILAIAAAKLGYHPVQCFDFNADSIQNARENVVRNHVADRVKPVRKDLTRQPLDTKRKHDVVCANLIYDLLVAERERIGNRVAPEGTLVLAGILETQFPKVKRAFQQAGWKLARTTVEAEWQSGAFVRR